MSATASSHGGEDGERAVPSRWSSIELVPSRPVTGDVVVAFNDAEHHDLDLP